MIDFRAKEGVCLLLEWFVKICADIYDSASNDEENANV